MFSCYLRTSSQFQRPIDSSVEKLCASKYLGCESFVVCLGVIGTLFTVADVFRIIQCGTVLDDDMWRRNNSRSEIVNPHVKRDLKLISSILGAEHYMLLIAGTLLGKPTFLVPWLALQGFVILMEIVIFFVKLISGGVHLFKGEVIIYALLVHNWFQVLCYFTNMTCD